MIVSLSFLVICSVVNKLNVNLYSKLAKNVLCTEYTKTSLKTKCFEPAAETDSGQ